LRKFLIHVFLCLLISFHARASSPHRYYFLPDLESLSLSTTPAGTWIASPNKTRSCLVFQTFSLRIPQENSSRPLHVRPGASLKLPRWTPSLPQSFPPVPVLPLMPLTNPSVVPCLKEEFSPFLRLFQCFSAVPSYFTPALHKLSTRDDCLYSSRHSRDPFRRYSFYLDLSLDFDSPLNGKFRMSASSCLRYRQLVKVSSNPALEIKPLFCSSILFRISWGPDQVPIPPDFRIQLFRRIPFFKVFWKCPLFFALFFLMPDPRY